MGCYRGSCPRLATFSCKVSKQIDAIANSAQTNSIIMPCVYANDNAFYESDTNREEFLTHYLQLHFHH